MLIQKSFSISITGLIAGIISGLLGAGGGIIVVPALIKLGLEPQKAHAASVCIMLPICVVGAIMYIKSGTVCMSQALNYIPAGIFGAIVGSFALSKINQNILRKIFGCFSLWAALRLLLK